mmetsp:Transcript_20484/g.26493  ORF Transcript_20484/g.26493 Transcript_20484/m.26493 type:complete len:106 (-) Transcript_20484:115-432(-)|eukprot:CAMPEP_0116053456 /NCGR_PEP_ID=MMETSP0322-20121206/2193_1 /TAXON_ID=163516 /ORGANISM="Leptocylindrus danicus var. apora, Strain B651" /LENGTH=105 /DNA_ID=CAMNT_0003536613 /DNA_START=341 /DNA_END=655 /DNA_ORIENTATION=-
MTYRSRGRSLFEVIVAMIFVAFLVGFITVLCIGNYFRAKRAQERQRQRRLAKQAADQRKKGFGVNNRMQTMQSNQTPFVPDGQVEIEMPEGQGTGSYQPPIPEAA